MPEEPPDKFTKHSLGLDGPAKLEALGGTLIVLIALFSSYDHITIAEKSIYLQQQWGIWIIFISFPILFIDAKLATRQRDRATNETARDRNRATGARERQRQAIALLHRSAVLTARFQLEPNELKSEPMAYQPTVALGRRRRWRLSSSV
ncbi:hypothetical protein [Synechococcus sp. UW140]|uniref:hypothetical protein n=1 Tax=Synechococcus sp. UW140 TaxID=368503 RepID=UPI0031377346